MRYPLKMDNQTNILEVNNLNVFYGKFQAVNNLSFSVARGEILGLLGPNGAGKTSTLSTVEGLIKQQSGTVTVAGKTRNTWYYGYTVGFHLGTLEGNPALQPFATVGANLVLIGKATDATMDDINNGGYAYYGIDKYPSDQVFTGSATATVGCIYNFATTAGVKLDLGYNYSFSGSSSNTEYKFYTSHMFVSLGVRLHIIDK